MTRLIEPSLVQIGRTITALLPDTPDSGKLAIRPDHPRRRIEVKVCMPGGLRRLLNTELQFY